ncbi:sll0787 family AIR synthase-like protein [Hyphomicrobium sp.]|jgi:hypothetical protein|uniref:sll0787 family AIR synthase-like protein n=1 Tax=Hyphomicrobium sp. TaxID=82 RepID=UPI003562470E
MTLAPDIIDLAERLRKSRAFAAKSTIATVAEQLDLNRVATAAVGDDCAAIPDGGGYLLFAIEGFLNEFVTGDPWFAGWCGIMVNLGDVAAMGGRPVAVVDCILASNADEADPILAGMKAASRTFGIPIVGGHTCTSGAERQLSVAILGRAKKLLTSFDAEPGDHLIAAIDLRGRYREPYSNWEAATDAPPERLRACYDILPTIAERGLSKAAKDISQAGIVGTSIMLAECSNVGITINLDKIPKPPGVPLERWLQTFPSFGFILSVPPQNTERVLAMFSAQGVAAADVGAVTKGTRVEISDSENRETIWDFATSPLLGLGRREATP